MLMMSKKSGQVPGYPYLSKRGTSYRVRVQVPASLKDIVGQGELIKSLGSDLSRVKRYYHQTVAGFVSQIEEGNRDYSGKQQFSDQSEPRGHQVSLLRLLSAHGSEHARESG
jgi:hypothetical protein